MYKSRRVGFRRYVKRTNFHKLDIYDRFCVIWSSIGNWERVSRNPHSFMYNAYLVFQRQYNVTK